VLTLEGQVDLDIAMPPTVTPTESEVEPMPVAQASPIKRARAFQSPNEHRRFGIEARSVRDLVEPVAILYRRFMEGNLRHSDQSDLGASRTQPRGRIDMDWTAASGMSGISVLDPLDAIRDAKASTKKKGSTPASVRFV
jgi:hypothetical protein